MARTTSHHTTHYEEYSVDAAPEEDHLGKGASVLFGFLLVILGIAALSSFYITTYATILFFGWLLLIGGLVRVVLAFWGKKWSGFFLDLFMGILLSITGVLFINNPSLGLGTITLLLGFVFMVGGFMSVIASLAVRYHNWGWSFAYGIFLFIFGIAVLRHYPLSGILLVGLFVGLEFFLGGAALIAGAVSPQHSSKPTTHAATV